MFLDAESDDVNAMGGKVSSNNNIISYLEVFPEFVLTFNLVSTSVLLIIMFYLDSLKKSHNLIFED